MDDGKTHLSLARECAWRSVKGISRPGAEVRQRLHSGGTVLRTTSPARQGPLHHVASSVLTVRQQIADLGVTDPARSKWGGSSAVLVRPAKTAIPHIGQMRLPVVRKKSG